MMIDEKDRLILFELFQNSRQSNKKIAKTLRLPEKTVYNRIKRMIDEKVITKFTCIINYQFLGYNRHSLYLDLKPEDESIIEKKVSKILNLEPISCCYFLNEMSEWKLYISSWTKTIGEFDDLQTEILSILDGLVINYVSFQSVKSYTYLSRLLNPNKISKCDVKEDTKNIPITKQDHQLLKLLHSDSRMPLLELANTLNIHTDTVKRSIKKLKEKNILQRLYPLIDHTKVGIREYTFICRINPSGNKRIEELINWAKKDPHFVIIIKAVGWVNLYYAFQVRDYTEFKLIRKRIRNILKDSVLKEYRIEVEKIIG